ncbi:MAG TPA: 2-iminoacetate synthase ThiH [Candidatus Saccharimonadales bacterium]|nr:2-iminoacetate synthase ThiH [Candidatus Saccharimonadales bacterium]
MSFVAEFNALPLDELTALSVRAGREEVEQSLGRTQLELRDFARLLSPAAGSLLETLGRRSQAITRQRFGRVIRLFAPLYLSNECINNCRYCGFSRDNPILRVTLSVPEVQAEARALRAEGFRNLLLVAGEHPKFVAPSYLADCVRALREDVPGLSLEVGPMETVEYRPIVEAGAEGLVVYQETYDRPVYAAMHTAGPKRNFDWRLETPERAYAAGFRRLGIGALYGLADWRREAIAVAAHATYLLRRCWKAQLTISLPRLRPCAGEFEPLTHLADRELVQLVCAFRLLLPDAGLVLSTREPARLRDGLIPLGITLLSAGSHTEPGGYTGAGRQNIHRTERGRIVELAAGASEWATGGTRATAATGQFEIADERSAHEIAELISRLGYEPVWKDWDAGVAAKGRGGKGHVAAPETAALTTT